MLDSRTIKKNIKSFIRSIEKLDDYSDSVTSGSKLYVLRNEFVNIFYKIFTTVKSMIYL